MNKKTMRFAFFGTPEFAVITLNELEQGGFVPAVVVTAPDRPAGRGLKLTPPPVKLWSEKRNIPVLQPENLNNPDFLSGLRTYDLGLFIIAAYGKIIPKTIIDLPRHGVLNVHPSLLPKYRGASPIETQILNDDRDVGVTIMQIDEEMDHGPIIKNEKVKIKNENWPPKKSDLESLLAHEGGKLLAETIPEWVAGNITAAPQDHNKATYSKLIKKEDAEIALGDNDYKNLLKIRAYDASPRAYFFVAHPMSNKKVRVIVADAEWKDNGLAITKVIPEGKREMDYASFLKTYTPTPQS